MEPHQLTLSGLSGDFTRNPVIARLDPSNNLPTTQVFHHSDPMTAIEALSTTLLVISNSNINLSEPEKELLRWHYRLGHLSFQKIQFLLCSCVLLHSAATRRLHASASQLNLPPKCAACMYGKQHHHPAPGKILTIVQNSVGALKKDNLHPGQQISVDHFMCSMKG